MRRRCPNRANTGLQAVRLASRYPIPDEDDGRFHVVYVIQHIRSGCFYIGSHTDESWDSVWRTYFTSSKVVKAIIDVEGAEAFKVCHLFYNHSRRNANFLESHLIQLNSPDTNLFILNKAYNVKKSLFTKVVEWDVVQYKSRKIAVNPNCMILDESYIHSESQEFKLPKRLLKLPHPIRTT